MVAGVVGGGINGAWSSALGSLLLGEMVAGPLGWIVLGYEEGNNNNNKKQ